ncbi:MULTISPECIES: DUF3012 domain-containing protein [Thiomicrorhabdus]|uniref:DUF3012 domain-containing protein n=1 Tax=Thiomicrorhabdus heinhorstiae TaxID=2748010 RepID=A0ABS0BUF4_9GAMM|nr:MULTISPECIES: DUF3012 domain-containing protein [Thiomicrorhabdus]MBF6056735.1 DUF3012 domain-containing protein [Thiomicrorhabdus heinhorstiae]
MKAMYAILLGSALFGSAVFMAGCSAEVGSDEWCAEMKEKPKGEWTANEASEFAKNCLLK